MHLYAIAVIALTLHRPQPMVALVYDSAPLEPVLNCAVVEGESQFNPKAWHGNYKDGKLVSTDWGLYQLNSAHHPQYRGDLEAHVHEGGATVAELLLTYGERWRAVAHYNPGQADYAAYIRAIFERIKVALILDQRYGGRP